MYTLSFRSCDRSALCFAATKGEPGYSALGSLPPPFRPPPSPSYFTLARGAHVRVAILQQAASTGAVVVVVIAMR